jgi:hypothetical protein
MMPPGMRPIPDPEAEMHRLAQARKTPPADPAQIRALLRECVTVVAPGETLIIRAHRNWTPKQVGEYQRALDDAAEYLNLPFRAVALMGEEFAVAKAAG